MENYGVAQYIKILFKSPDRAGLGSRGRFGPVSRLKIAKNANF